MSDLLDPSTNRVTSAAAKFQDQLDGITADALAKVIEATEIRPEEVWAYKDALSWGQSAGALTLEETLTAQDTLMAHEWRPGTTTAMKIAVMKTVSELMAVMT